MDYWRDVEARAQKWAQEMVLEKAEELAQEIAQEKTEKLAQEMTEKVKLFVYRMLDDGLPAETVARFTDVSVDVIQKWEKDREK